MLKRAAKVHPAGLFYLFFTEMWERLSYYGMRALLVLYMTKYLLVDPERFQSVIGLGTLKSIIESGKGTPLDVQPFSSELYGLYTGFVYLSPFFGGILADKVLGKKKTVYVGAILMAIGHFLMAFEQSFLLALFFLILGNGAFKPNISSQVGNLYPEGDSRRDGAFTLFYMGINLGAFFSPILCANLAAWIAELMGRTEPQATWHIGFTIAGIGMMLGVIIYHMGRKHLPPETAVLAPEAERNKITAKTIAGLLAVMVGFFLFLALPLTIKIIVGAVILGGIGFTVTRVQDKVERSKVTALVVLCALTIFFWAIFEQQGNTLELWADEKADWTILGGRAETYQSFNPFFIFLFAPLLDAWWAYRERQGKKSSSVRKMAIGSFLAGGSFLFMAWGSTQVTVDKSLINMAWLGITTFIFTMGELYLSPIGLSFVTKVAPARMLAMLMGMWFLSSFIGNYLAGYLGGFYSSMSNQSFFMMFFALGTALGVGFLVSEKVLQNAIGKDV
ncbi:MAG: peptide MFS transporter [Bdellovibrionales bacterium]|nr:peptide MFS transporter [Bdellovibrionales bacterium]